MADAQTTLVRKIDAVVARKWAGDYRAAFAANDADGDGKMDAVEIDDLLKLAGVGNFLTRAAFVRGVMAKLDADLDGAVTWPEFETVFQPGGPT